MRKFLATCNTWGTSVANPICRWVDIDEENQVDGQTWLGDFGMYLVLDEEVTPKEASELFFALLTQAEGSHDYRGDPITDKPTDSLTSEKTLRIWKGEFAR